MTRLTVLALVGVLAAAPRASAACRWFGTQLECDVGATRTMVIGTQVAAEPTYETSFPIQSFRGDGDALDDQTVSRRPLAFELQNFGGAASRCRKIGNETYCY